MRIELESKLLSEWNGAGGSIWEWKLESYGIKLMKKPEEMKNIERKKASQETQFHS